MPRAASSGVKAGLVMAAPTRWGDEFLANVVTSGTQNQPVIVALAQGGFALAYGDASSTTNFGGTDTDLFAIRLQMFDSGGNVSAGPVQVNTATSSDQGNPTMVALASGGVAIAWDDASLGADTGGDDTSLAVRLARFDADGASLGVETLLNVQTTGDQYHPVLESLATGEIMAAWSDLGGALGDGDGAVIGAVLAGDGTTIISDFTLNSVTSDVQEDPDIAALGTTGNAVVVYADRSSGDRDIRAKVVDRFGATVVAEFVVNTTTQNDQFAAKVAALASGDFVVVWTDGSATGGDPSSFAIRAQRFGADGQAKGDEILVNKQVITGQQLQPEILALSDGRFVVAWHDRSEGVDTGGDDDSGGAVRARLFKANGKADGPTFLVNDVTEGFQSDVTMAELVDGRIVFAYLDTSNGVETQSDDTTSAIRATIFETRTKAVTWRGDGEDNDYAGTNWADVLKGRGGDDRLSGGDENDRLYGGTGDDALFGGNGKDRLFGEDGADSLSGQGGKDRLFGGADADVLAGGSGADRLRGEAGGDRIKGGLGADNLGGGGGADTFVYATGADSLKGSTKRDVIVDFTAGKDVIDLSALDANLFTGDNDAFAFIGQAEFSRSPGELRFVRKSLVTFVRVDMDGDAKADLEIELTGRMMLDAGDFIL